MMQNMKNDNLKINHLSTIKILLEEGGRITVLGYFKVFSSFELRHWIAILRKDGMKISDEWKSNNGKRYKEYYLSK